MRLGILRIFAVLGILAAGLFAEPANVHGTFIEEAEYEQSDFNTEQDAPHRSFWRILLVYNYTCCMLIPALVLSLLIVFPLMGLGHLLKKQNLPRFQAAAALVFDTGLGWKETPAGDTPPSFFTREWLAILSSAAE